MKVELQRLAAPERIGNAQQPAGGSPPKAANPSARGDVLAASVTSGLLALVRAGSPSREDKIAALSRAWQSGTLATDPAALARTILERGFDAGEEALQ